jgi:hypothetical protein
MYTARTDGGSYSRNKGPKMKLGFAFCVGEGLETKGETQGQRPNAWPARPSTSYNTTQRGMKGKVNISR